MSEKKEFNPLDVGATERIPWKLAQGLSKHLHFDEKGNAVFGADLEVDGTTKLNGGLKPIHHYKLGEDISSTTLDIYFESVNSDNNHYFIGRHNDGIAIGAYKLDGGNVSAYTIISVDGPYDQEAYIYYKEEGGDEIYYVLANGDNTQSKLFIHTLTLTADKSYTLIYQSTADSSVNSIAGLRGIMNVTTISDNVILPVCATDLSGTAVLQVTTSLCKVGTANVTAISDKVTTL